MKAIDTSLLYAAFNVDDEWHDEGLRVLDKERPLLIPPGVLQETLDLLGRRHGGKAAASALAWLAAQPRIVVEPGHSARSHQAALDALLAAPKLFAKLSFADLWCVAHAREHGVPLLSRDKAQLAAYAKWSKT